MQTYSILLVDDDVLFADRVKQSILALNPNDFTVDVMDDAQVKEGIQSIKYDVYILDIEMPVIDGFTLAQQLHERDKDSLLIFLTTHREFSLTGYEYRAFRFLIKENYHATLEKTLKAALLELQKRHMTIEVKNEASMWVHIKVDDIKCAYAEKNYIMLKTDRGLYQMRTSLGEFETAFANFPFSSPSKGLLVNLSHIDYIDFDKNIIYLKHSHGNIPISRRRRKQFYEHYAKGI